MEAQVIEFELNGEQVSSNSPADTPLLWVIRDELKLKGTKFGCGIAQCGACTVHLDGAAVRLADRALIAVADDRGRRVPSQETGSPDDPRLIFTANATARLNLTINGLVNPGDHVVTSVVEHNSVLRPLYQNQGADGFFIVERTQAG